MRNKASFVAVALALSSTLCAVASTAEHDALTYKASCLAKIGRCAFPSFSPDDKTIVFVSDMSGTPQLWTMPIEGGWPKQITNFPDTVIGEEWSPKSEWISLLLQAGGADRPFYIVKSDGTELKLMSGQHSDNILCGWTADGRYALNSSRVKGERIRECLLADPESGKLKPLSSKHVEGYITDVSADNRYALVIREVTQSDTNLYRVDLSTGSESLLTPHSGKVSFTGGYLNRSRMRFGPDGKCVYFLTNENRGDEEFVFAKIDIADNGKPGPVKVLAERKDANAMGFSFDGKQKNVALCWQPKNENCEIEVMDLGSGKRTMLPAVPVDRCIEMEFSHNGQTLAMSLTGPCNPEDVWLYELQNARYRQLTHSQHAGIKLGDLVKPEVVSFTAHDGVKLTGIVFRPRNGSKPAPYVVSFNSGKSSNFEMQTLLAEGIGVFCPAIREIDVFRDKNVPDLVNGKAIGDERQDIKSAVDYLIDNKLADPERIGIMGQSHGGRLALLGATEFPETFAACEEDYGIVNYFSYLKQISPETAKVQRIKGVDAQTEAAVLHKLSVIEKADRIKAPVLVQTGALDNHVPAAQQDEIVDTLKRNGSSVEYLSYADEGHAFFKEANRVKSAVATARFFSKHLKR